MSNWHLNFKGTYSWKDFWWTPNDGKIRRHASTSAWFENGEVKVSRTFFSLRALVSHIIGVPIYNARLLAQRLHLPPTLAFQLGVITLNTATGANATSTSPLTFSHTISGANTLLVAGSRVSSSGSPSSSASYNSVGMTQTDTNANSTDGVWQFYLVSPTTGTNSVAITFGGTSPNCAGGCSSYTGAAQTSTLNTNNNGSGVEPQTTAVTTTVNNCMVVGTGYGIFSSSRTLGNSVLTDEWAGSNPGLRPIEGSDKLQGSAGLINSTFTSGGAEGVKQAVGAYASALAGNNLTLLAVGT